MMDRSVGWTKFETRVMDHTDFMAVAVTEAEASLKEGNCGFGAVVVRHGEILARCHDTEKTGGDPTAHAEMGAIQKAAKRCGRNLRGCQIYSTHEPCPMCATALLWSGIDEIFYGYSIRESLRQGRRRIDISCREIFERAGLKVTLREGVLRERCAVLYNAKVREQIEQLRQPGEAALRDIATERGVNRVRWFNANKATLPAIAGKPLETAYRVLLERLGVTPAEAPILHQDDRRLTFGSKNFCPTLEACRILGLDTRIVCKQLTEKPTEMLVRQVDPRLRFQRNYETLRPHGAVCEESIVLHLPGEPD
jgi:tRNA(adenine34) deaminase